MKKQNISPSESILSTPFFFNHLMVCIPFEHTLIFVTYIFTVKYRRILCTVKNGWGEDKLAAEFLGSKFEQSS
jgi:hypothetical protein